MRNDFRPCAVSPGIWQCGTAEREVPGRQLVAKVYFHQRPHIYSQQELEQLLAATGRLWPTYPLKRLMYRDAFWAFGMYRVAGLRGIETQCCGHVDLDHGVLRIEKTKFKKSRLVPLHPTATRALRRYAKRDMAKAPCVTTAPFFVGGDGNRLTYRAVQRVFHQLRDMLGWKKGNGEWPRPRIHDLRHSFACRRLLSWYRQGKNVHHLIAALSTYLGHGHSYRHVLVSDRHAGTPGDRGRPLRAVRTRGERRASMKTTKVCHAQSSARSVLRRYFCEYLSASEI